VSVYILRHGESEANVNIEAFAKYGNTNVPVTEKGMSQIRKAGMAISKDAESPLNGLAVFSSMYHRCYTSSEALLKAMQVQSKINKNLLLSEINCGEQEGCDVEDFKERPVEGFHYDKAGPLQYKPHRGESFLDIHTRMGVFAIQQNFFRMFPTTIIVGHASTCLMLHYFLIQECPDDDILNLKASFYWPNALVRKYTPRDSSGFYEYNGVLQEDLDDALVSQHAKP